MTFTNLLIHVSLKHLRTQKARLLITLSGICLGIAAIASIEMVNGSVLHSFEDSINQVTGRTALQIYEAEAGFPEKILDRVQNVPGVEYAVPVIETNAKVFGGSERSIMILGVDVLQDSRIRDYSITDEMADIPDPLLFLAKPNSILITRAMAEQEGIKMDQDLKVQTVQGIKTFKVRGLLNPEGPAKVAGGDIAVMDIYAAQMAFGKEGRLDRIDLSLRSGENLGTMKKRLQQVLPKGYTVDTPAGRTKQVETMLKNFRKNTGLISFLAMFVGMYLIYNAVSISVVQRMKEIGILRALGATRGQIIRLFLGETLAISILGSFLGFGLGIVFAKCAVGLVAQSITEIYLKTSVSGLAITGRDLIRDVGIGILASLTAAAFPSVRSARITPVSAIRALPYMKDGFWTGRRMKAASAAFVLLSLLIVVAFKMADLSSMIRSSGVMLWAMLFLLLGVSLSTPFFLRWFMIFFHRFLSSRLGPGGRLAGLNLQKNISRNAVAVAAIFYGIALFVGSANLINSFRNSFYVWYDSILRADIMISSGHLLAAGGATNIAMPGEMWKEIGKIPGVRSAEPFRKARINYQGRRILVEAFDVVKRLDYCPLMLAEGSREDLLRLLPRQNNIAVSEGFALRYRLKPGDSLILPTPNGPIRFGVAAIVVSYTSDSGTILMDISTYQRLWLDTLADVFEVRVKAEAEIPAVRKAIFERFGKERRLFILSAGEFKAELKKIMDRSFMVSNAIMVITLFIACLGIVITLLASVLERRREIGLLRAIGTKRKQVSGIVLIESTLIGAVGGLLGSATGLLIGWLSLEGFIRIDFGASITYHIHYASLIWALLLAAGLSALAGLYPSRQAAKTNIVEALTYE